MRIKLRNFYWVVLLLVDCHPTWADTGEWQAGGTIDLGYANALQSEDISAYRSKATTTRLNEFSPNMGMFYLRKLPTEYSRWGVDIGGQAGYDTDGQVPGNDRISSYSIIRYLSRANVSYLAPIRNDLTLTAGLMNSFIGFESMYAKDNFNYTRTWIADYSPYFLIGMGGQYALDENLSVSLYLVSDYDYLAYRGDQPKYAGQVAWRLAPDWKLTQNVFVGPEQTQANTANWRYFSDTIVQWSGEDVTMALAYDIGTERLDKPGANSQVLWMGSALFTRWHIDGPWSVALRPEIYWDRDGHLTSNRQMIKSITATLEYKIPLDLVSVALRSEYRYDDSTGSHGGFFKFNNSQDLIAGQHAFFLSCLISFDRSLW